jgi:acetoin:2,6-dichlorophenolindophenol oxidoreductase subunit beta
MARMKFSEAVDRAIAEAMAKDERVIVMGEDVPILRSGLLARFGSGRVMGAPISEAAFTSAGVGAAMAGLRPVVEILMVDFVACAMDAVLNNMAKLEAFSGGRWKCPMVIRTGCGGGYGDGGQHEQALWGMLGGIPGLTVLAPSNPADAYGLMASALAHDGPVIFLEHKLLSEQMLEFLGRSGRNTVSFDLPADGVECEVPETATSVPLGSARVLRSGADITIVSLAVGVHRSLEAARVLETEGIGCEVIDLRTVRPLDAATITASVTKTGRLLVVDEDYRECGLSGEVAAVALEAGLRPRFARVCLEGTLPFARHLETRALPNTERIAASARKLMASVGP